MKLKVNTDGLKKAQNISSQIEKVQEELDEVREAYNDLNGSNFQKAEHAHYCEELADLVTSVFNLVDMCFYDYNHFKSYIRKVEIKNIKRGYYDEK